MKYFLPPLLLLLASCELYKSEGRKDFESLSSYKASVANITLICSPQTKNIQTCFQNDQMFESQKEACLSPQISLEEQQQVLEEFCLR